MLHCQWKTPYACVDRTGSWNDRASYDRTSSEHVFPVIEHNCLAGCDRPLRLLKMTDDLIFSRFFHSAPRRLVIIPDLGKYTSWFHQVFHRHEINTVCPHGMGQRLLIRTDHH